MCKLLSPAPPPFGREGRAYGGDDHELAGDGWSLSGVQEGDSRLDNRSRAGDSKAMAGHRDDILDSVIVRRKV
jgi:hypothetical protein